MTDAQKSVILRTDDGWEVNRQREDWVFAFYDDDRQILGAAYSLPFTVPEGTWIALYKSTDSKGRPMATGLHLQPGQTFQSSREL